LDKDRSMIDFEFLFNSCELMFNSNRFGSIGDENSRVKLYK